MYIVAVYTVLHVIYTSIRRHLLETEGREHLLASCASPDLIEAAGIVVTVLDVNNKGAHSAEPGDKEESFSEPQAGERQPNSCGMYILLELVGKNMYML